MLKADAKVINKPFFTASSETALEYAKCRLGLPKCLQ